MTRTDGGDLTDTGPAGWWRGAKAAWYSGFRDDSVDQNLNGLAFALYLMPAQPANAFSPTSASYSDGTGAQAYADICADAGLHPVTGGSTNYYPTQTDCARYNCMPLALRWDDAATVNIKLQAGTTS